MQKDADVKALEGASSKPTGYVQICLSYSLFLPSIRVLKFLEDEGTSVAPLKRTLHPISSAEAIPAISSAEAVPVVSPVEAIIHPQGSSCATGGILRGHAAATYYSPADDKNIALNIIGTTKLTAKIYTLSNLDPLNLNHNNMAPSSKVTIKMSPNLGPILDNFLKHYPAIKGIFYLNI